MVTLQSLRGTIYNPSPGRPSAGEIIQILGGSLKRSATIWASGRTRDPYFEILGARKQHPKYPEQPVTGVPKVIEQILRFKSANTAA